MALGQLRGPSWLTRSPLHCPNWNSIVASGGLDVCDGAHWSGVMKKIRGRKNLQRDGAVESHLSKSAKGGAPGWTIVLSGTCTVLVFLNILLSGSIIPP